MFAEAEWADEGPTASYSPVSAGTCLDLFHPLSIQIKGLIVNVPTFHQGPEI